ncbi:MAG TPA: hypothetical protein VES88_13810 [Gemmatimonadaceae bacterium]|nr:hypothetical protein [Gemmatimonadaceae bacterium]
MRPSDLLCCAILLVGCAKTDTAADSATATDTATPAATVEPAPISLDQIAGKWNVRVLSAETGDSTLTSYVLDAKADTAGWLFTFPTGAPIPMHVMSMAGDSLVTQAGPFDSRLQKGVKVHTVVTWRLRDGKLVGAVVSHYDTKPPTTRNLIADGTRQ